MSIMVYEVAHDLKYRLFRDTFTVKGLLEGRQEVEDSKSLRIAEAANFHIVPDAAGLILVVARDI